MNNNDSSAPSGSSSCRVDEAKARETNSLIHGRREPREFHVETYSKDSQEANKLFPKEYGCSSTQKLCTDKSDGVVEVDSVLSFVSGNPFVEMTRGILHLYKENILSTIEAGSERCDTLCILAVPATMTCHDLLNFTAAYHEDIRHLRIIKDGTPNQYMALVTFRTQEMACAFFTSFNGEPFNSLEPDCVCHLVFVSRIDVEESQPQLPSGHTELPTCPVCLERMDESVDGILTILCNHSFHSNCLAKWGDTSCPVCRYVQTPELLVDNRCLQCLSIENLWICLICGHVGCGRYVEGHAYKHFLATNHCYSMLLGSNRVWDYAGDNFVHRLLQNKGDGKLVEAEQPTKEQGIDEKMDAIQLEWTYHLTSQLEKQREYFEDKIMRIQESFTNEAAETRHELLKTKEENKELKTHVNRLKNERTSLEKKVASLSIKLNTATTQLRDEKQITQALQLNQTEWQSKFNSLDKKFKEYQDEKVKELFDLKEQLRDVMFFLEAKKQIEASDARDEIAQGTIVVAESPSTSEQSKHRRRKHKK